ncbi:MAG: DEAD/DEAH box helicase [Chloroflexi bacterium]|nr:DEAD/DEAH box helicase [Chloroflexota bacterium]
MTPLRPVYVAFDLELTGLDPRDEIIELAAVKFDPHRELARFQTLVRPTGALPLAVARLTGLHQRDLQQAPTFAEVRDAFRTFVGEAPLVGQSPARDLEALERQGLPLTNPVFDTFELASILLPDLPSYRLSAIASRLGVTVTQAHRALADALTTKEVFLALLAVGRSLDPQTLAEIVQLASLTDWPLKQLFQQLEREVSKRTTGSSLGAILASKAGLDVANLDFLTRAPDRLPSLEPAPAASEPAPIAQLLEPGSLGSETVPGFEYRPEQVEMLTAVQEAVVRGEHLLVEAGTGTGKSLAYLLPSAEWARRTGNRVVISTATLTLQEQLVKHDLPKVAALLERWEEQHGESLPPLRTAVVKGRTNYLCLRRWAEFRRAPVGLTRDEVRLLCRLLVWLPQTATGDRAELNLAPGEQVVWARLSAQADDCLTGRCTFQKRGTCFLYRARRAAEHAHVVVVNHALLLSDLAANYRVLPEYSRLVIDEAHHLEDEATRQFGFTISRRDLLRQLDAIAERRGHDRWRGLVAEAPVAVRAAELPAWVSGALNELLGQLEEQCERARPAVAALAAALDPFLRGSEGDHRTRITPQVRQSALWEAVVTAWEPLDTLLGRLAADLARLETLLEPHASSRQEALSDLLLEVSSLRRRSVELREGLQHLVLGPEPGLVTWIEGVGGDPVLAAAPLEVAGRLSAELFSQKESVVLTSATLSAENSFAYVRQRLGLLDAKELQLGSPFNFAERALVLVPADADFPEPTQPGYDAALARVITETAIATGGRMLVLFTANASLRRVRTLVRGPLERHDIAVLGQNIDGPRTQLLTRLRENDRTVVLGAASFWEGVDIPGEALSVVVLTRLPFGVPSDPLFAARQEAFPDGFFQFAVPQAVLRFRQGFGRLIRSKQDRGVVLVLDTRLRTKGYGAAFRRSLPCPVETVPASAIPTRVVEFLESHPRC